MSSEKKEENEKEKKEEKKETKVEDDKAKLEERKKRFGGEEEEEKYLMIKRAERFGLKEKEDGNKDISSKEDLDKRKERFKDDLQELEAEEKDKPKGGRGRIYKKNHFKRSNNRGNFSRGYRKSNRDFRKRGSNERRFRGRRNNSYRK